MLDPQLVSCIKALLFPRFLTPFDLDNILKASEKTGSIGNLAKATIKRLTHPLTKIKNDSLVLETNNIEIWFESIAKACESFLDLNMKNVAWSLLSQWLSYYLFLLSNVHARKILPKKVVKLLPLSVAPDAITKLIEIPEYFEKIMTLAGFLRAFKLALNNLIFALEIATKDTSLQVPKKYILSEDTYLEILEKMSLNEIHITLPTIAFLAEAVGVISLQQVPDELKQKVNRFKKLLRDTFKIISHKLIEKPQENLATWISRKLMMLLEKPSEIEHTLREIGEKILHEKFSLFKQGFNLALKIPPELHNFVLPRTPPTLDVTTELQPSLHLLLPLETIEIIQAAFNEIRFFLRYAMLENPMLIEKICDFIKDPLLSFALYFLLGLPEIFLFDICILLFTSPSNNIQKISRKISTKLARIITEQVNISNTLEGTLRKISVYLLARVSFHLNARLVHETEELLKNMGHEELISACQSLNDFVEKELGYIPREPPDISTLFT